MLGLHDTETPAEKYPPFTLNGVRVLGLRRDSIVACYVIINLQTGRQRLPLCQARTGPDTTA